MSIEEALAYVPENWRNHGLISWPGYDHGKLVDEVRVELHHVFSSGGGPKVVAYGSTIAGTIAKAGAKASEHEVNWTRGGQHELPPRAG